MITNFGIMIPSDASKFISGTYRVFLTKGEIESFTEWCISEMPDVNIPSKLSVEEIQGIYKYWKFKNKVNELR